MKDGKCIKCGSPTVFSLANGVVPGGQDREYLNQGGMYIPVNVLSYLCTTCGYYENYIADQKKLSDLPKVWQKTPASE